MMTPTRSGAPRMRYLPRCVGCVLAMVSSFYLQPLLTHLLTLFSWAIEAVAPAFHVQQLIIDAPLNGQEAKFQLAVATTRAMTFASQTLPIGTELSASTLLSHSQLHFLLLYALISGWGIWSWRTLLRRWLFALPLWLLLEMIDTPLLLIGTIIDLIYANLAPERSSWLITWAYMLESGGRLALLLGAALFVIGGEEAWHPQLDLINKIGIKTLRHRRRAMAQHESAHSLP